MSSRSPAVVVIGGGTGSFTLLQALKRYTPEITALVNMADDGGSTGVLRDELGVLPPGDVRQSLVALSQSPQVMRDLFNYRFSEGTFDGHMFGNIFLTALEKVTGKFGEAVETASDVLKITGRVEPITLDDVRLILEIGDHLTVHGERNIDTMPLERNGRLPMLRLEPEAAINPAAREAILHADLVVISAGDIYTSLGPSLIVRGVPEALRQTEARIIYVCNLVVKPGHTDGFSVADHAAEIERFAGAPILDYVLYNTDRPESALLQNYTNEGELLVEADTAELAAARYRSIGRPFIARHAAKVDSHDKLAAHRSLIRHDAETVVSVIHDILTGNVDA